MKSVSKAKIKKIKLLALDVDGVLTDGRIIIDSDGREIKNFNVLDGFGIVKMRHLGFKVAIITARSSEPVTFRAKDLKIDKVYQDAYPKIEAYSKMLEELQVTDEEVCYIGDDIPDLDVLKRVGFAVAVENAHEELKKIAHYITEKRGGSGAVREV